MDRFKPNRRFRKEYNRLFKQDPLAANLFLLLCELRAKKNWMVVKGERELAELMAVRFNDPREYAL